MNKTNIRINKYLSEIGYCSRREADNLIKQGRVKANNNLVSLGTKVSVDSEIIGLLMLTGVAAKLE